MDFSQTYLYKFHKLTANLDKVFDQALRTHSRISLSQFTFLLAIDTLGQTNQQKIASFLEVSTPAISRQSDIAYGNSWIKRTPSPADRHGYALELTPRGKRMIKHGLDTLETHVLKVFANEHQQTDLMGHIDTLLDNVKSVVEEQTMLQQWEKLAERSVL